MNRERARKIAVFAFMFLIVSVFTIGAEADCVIEETTESESGVSSKNYTITEVVPGLMKIRLLNVVETTDSEREQFGHEGAFDEALQELNRNYLIGTSITPIQYFDEYDESSFTKELLVPVKRRK